MQVSTMPCLSALINSWFICYKTSKINSVPSRTLIPLSRQNKASFPNMLRRRKDVHMKGYFPQLFPVITFLISDKSFGLLDF